MTGRNQTATGHMLPWRYARNDSGGYDIRDDGCDLVGTAVLEVEAALIVRACNAHDAMLAALQASEREYENLEDHAPVDAGCIECTLGTVPNRLNTGLCAHHLRRAAIAKATGTAATPDQQSDLASSAATDMARG
jgi:hypothetical protein